MKQLILLFLAATGAATAQSDAVLSGLDWVPQHTLLRPHERPLGRGYVQLPGVDAGWSTNWLQPAQWLETDDAGTTVNAVAMLASLREANTLQFTAQADWVGMGRAFGPQQRHFITVGVSEHAAVDVSLPGDLIRLPFLGNAGFENGQVDAQSLAAQLLHYRSYHLGWQAHLSERWSAGVRLHHLRGFEFASLRDAGVTWATDADDWSWTVAAGAEVQTAGVAELLDTTAGNTPLEQGVRAYLGLAGDAGWAADAGVAFRPSERWSLEASVAGLGRIAWQRDTWSAKWSLDPVPFDGLALGAWSLDPDALQDSLDHWAGQTQAWADSAARPTTTEDGFTSSLPVRWNLRATRQLGPRISVQAALRDGLTGPVAATFGATLELGTALQAHVAYQHGNGLRALGAGFAAQFGPLQWYTAVDNVLAARLAAVELPDDRTAYLPLDASRLQVRTGLNWVIGRKPKRPDPAVDRTWGANSQQPGGQVARVCPAY